MAGKIKVTIDRETLAFKAEVEGHKGAGCATMLDDFQRMVGMTTTQQTLKPEYKEAHLRVPQQRR